MQKSVFLGPLAVVEYPPLFDVTIAVVVVALLFAALAISLELVLVLHP